MAAFAHDHKFSSIFW